MDIKFFEIQVEREETRKVLDGDTSGRTKTFNYNPARRTLILMHDIEQVQELEENKILILTPDASYHAEGTIDQIREMLSKSF